MMRRHHSLFVGRRLAALLLAAALPAALLGGCGESAEVSAAVPAATAEPQATAAPAARSGAQETDKTETVYAKADASGAVRETEVEAVLRCTGTGDLSDVSTLQDIRNTEGDEEFTRGADGALTWQNLGQDIHYKGTTQAELPVTVRITYTLDGQPIEPEDLAGQSGKVTIRFDYSNNADTSVNLVGREVAAKTPFTAATVLVLPEDHFSNVTADNGKVIEMDGDTVVVGTAFPGLAEQLALADYEATEDVELPDSLEITADAADFTLDFTATVLTAETLADLDTADLDDADELADDMEDLTDASGEVLDGIGELLDGMDTFGSYLDEYTQAVAKLNEGAAALKDGAKQLNDNKAALSQGADALRDGLGKLNTALGQISLPQATGESAQGADAAQAARIVQSIAADAAILQASLEALQPYLAAVSTAETAAGQGAQAAADLQAQMQQLAQLYSQLAPMLQSLSGMGNELNQLKTGVSQLYAGSQQLSSGIGQFNAGVGQLADGAAQLADGTAQLNDAGGELTDGYAKLTDGVEELEDGYREFDEDGIQKLADLAGEDLRRVLTNLRAAKAAGDAYTNFSGLAEGQTGSVRFVIETDEIKP